uniref:Uncharacterized protein AlNc14C12G1482 n=1 Tax=Albugo laibachii Nc14 TaxID=890382 RepID=F0W3A5_9STRA|nr:hypothetical protein PITG_23301 [Albugo laibachii Nc14]|eukprot:CCA15548.1 hypothetical protein PITG_23301 [Albugo laibachii Nc14]
MGNNTSNRLEASWKHLKDTVDAFMAVDECIACIMYYQSMLEKDLYARLYKRAVVRNAAYDTEMDRDNVCKVPVVRRRGQMFSIKNVSADEDSRDEPNVEYTVDRSSWTCSCMFMATILLPCHHVFYIRKSIRAECVIPTHLLNPRWLLSATRAPDTVNIQLVVPYKEGTVLQRQNAPWDKNHKFRAMNEIATRIFEAMCEYGMKEFQVALSALVGVETVFKKRCHQDLVRALKSINSSSDASVDFISQNTQSANPEAEIVDPHAQGDDHEALDHGQSPTIDIVDDMSNKNARATVSSDSEDPHTAGSARTRRAVASRMMPTTAACFSCYLPSKQFLKARWPCSTTFDITAYLQHACF